MPGQEGVGQVTSSLFKNVKLLLGGNLGDGFLIITKMIKNINAIQTHPLIFPFIYIFIIN